MEGGKDVHVPSGDAMGDSRGERLFLKTRFGNGCCIEYNLLVNKTVGDQKASNAEQLSSIRLLVGAKG